jgi:hypothetical protein
LDRRDQERRHWFLHCDDLLLRDEHGVNTPRSDEVLT